MLPSLERHLDAPLRYALATLVAEQGRLSFEGFPRPPLVAPKALQLWHQRVRQEHVAGFATLGNLAPQSYTPAWCSIGEVHVAHVETHDLRKP
jgi:hypothetical protein